MDATFWLNVGMRWLHVAAAVAGVGGAIVMRFVLLPAVERTAGGAEFLRAVQPAMKRLIHAAIGLLLVTGFYNYMAVSLPAVRARIPEKAGIYHGVMGVKILLSLLLFAIAILLLMPGDRPLANRKRWLSVNVGVGLLILLLAAFLRRLW